MPVDQVTATNLLQIVAANVWKRSVVGVCASTSDNRGPRTLAAAEMHR